MTALAKADLARVTARWNAVPDDLFEQALLDEDPTLRFATRMGREGEEHQRIAQLAQVRSIAASPWFWTVATALPCNRVWWKGKDTDEDLRRPGRPTEFPDYLMLLITAVAGIDGISTYRSAIATIRDPATWPLLVEAIDSYVPDGWTKLSDLPDRNKDTYTVTVPAGPKTARTRALRRRQATSNVVTLHKRVTQPPTNSQLDTFVKRWRGIGYDGQPLAPSDRYYRMRENAMEAFETAGVDQAQAMGILNPAADFHYRHPDRNQFIGGDGVVFSVRRSAQAATVGKWRTGEGVTVTGSKYMLTSCRIDGQRHSRIILSLQHLHSTHPGSETSEAAAVAKIVPLLREYSAGTVNGHTRYGIKGLLFDSAIRGKHVIALQRQGIVVVNYPHAASNPNGPAGPRLNADRREKSHLRTVLTHPDPTGPVCKHYVYAVGGEFVELIQTATGEDSVVSLPIVKYENRGNQGRHRQYLTVRVQCGWSGDFDARIPLFHTDAVSGDPDANWGEVCRVYPPGSAEFKYLYGARNDTEARHRDLKARVKYLPADVPGQQLRLLGGSIANNAVTWAVHLQAHGEPNAIDNTG